jgi:hypothetical protein
VDEDEEKLQLGMALGTGTPGIEELYGDND